MWSRLLKKKKKKEFFRNFCDGDLPGTSLLRNTLIMIHLRALAHRICVFLFWNIAFILFLWRLYVLDESGMRKDLCLFTKSSALWWMTQPAFSKCIISCPLFHDPFGILYVPAPDQQGVGAGCIPTAIQTVYVKYLDHDMLILLLESCICPCQRQRALHLVSIERTLKGFSLKGNKLIILVSAQC